MNRGEIWWASLAVPRGSEAGFRRPVLIVSSNAFNASAIKTVLVAVVTSNERLAGAPGNVRLSRKQSGLAKVSVVNVSQLLTLDKRYLVDRVKELQQPVVAEVEAGLKLVLGLVQ